mmetsp:Transcript_29720/g.74723  ORF Transcript_29720/g.74723 Transcript_29720/m.74723 type:complete len:200 (-) Transcript_29720:897-1496(-)
MRLRSTLHMSCCPSLRTMRHRYDVEVCLDPRARIICHCCVATSLSAGAVLFKNDRPVTSILEYPDRVQNAEFASLSLLSSPAKHIGWRDTSKQHLREPRQFCHGLSAQRNSGHIQITRQSRAWIRYRKSASPAWSGCALMGEAASSCDSSCMSCLRRIIEWCKIAFLSNFAESLPKGRRARSSSKYCFAFSLLLCSTSL